MKKLKIPKLPTYTTTLPSNGEQVTYRPITVREESFLLQVKESEDRNAIENGIHQVIKNCVDYPIKKLKSIDVSWLFLQIRIKSVSNEVELSYRCTRLNEETGNRCGASFGSIIDLEKVEIKGEPKITLNLTFATGDYILSFEQPGIEAGSIEDETRVLYSMLEYIIDCDGEILTKDDIEFEEFEEFVGTFTGQQTEQLKEALGKVGRLYYKNKLVCPACGNTNEVVYDKLTDFFT